ncbi:hypothetical protein BFW88_08935 [Pseudomonas fluorescens]|nr:hypothetical protein BFW88_08935 [Pseudomonas fluorescens]OPB13173.1 hypothetical protein BFW92_08910 [Pseudomonas fluorescens]OPB24278.1 hypothetical protein BFW93_08945 [Pseudomonas fluorescens]
MTRNPPPAAPDDLIARAVGVQFSHHPTLVSVSAQWLTVAIQQAYPTLAINLAITKVGIPNAMGGWDLRYLLNVALDHLRGRGAPDFAPRNQREYFLTQNAPHPLVPGGEHAPPIDMRVIERIIRELPAIVPLAFQQALLSYWEREVAVGVNRWRWLAQWLSSNLFSTAVEPSSSGTVRTLLKQIIDYPDRLDREQAMKTSAAHVYLLETTLVREGRSYRLLTPDLLVMQASQTLVCDLSGAIEVFASRDEFERYWHQKISRQLVADRISWQCYEPNGNVFEAQAGVVLDQQLENVAAIQLPDVSRHTELELEYDALTDPSCLFVQPTAPASRRSARSLDDLPGWLKEAPVTQRLAYRAHLLELAGTHAEAPGRSFLDGVDTLRTFAARALRAQMSIDQPLAPGYNPDEVELTFAVAAGYPGGAGIVRRISISLTEFALKNLAGKPAGTLTVRHTGGQLIQEWTTPDYLLGLVQRVDIGKTYPEYLKRLLLSDGDDARQRQRLFCDQLRVQLPLQALGFAIQGQHGFTEQGYRYIAALMQRSDTERVVQGRHIVIRSLALLRRSGAVPDVVSNMFVIESQDLQPGPVVLYRPLYPDVMTQFPDRGALFAAIAEPGVLQDSVLTWLNDGARPLYAHGGFNQPHILRFNLGAEFDRLTLPGPATLAGDNGSEELLQHQGNGQLLSFLFGEHARALVDLADRESVSNAESRWAVLLEGAGLLLNSLLLPLLRGPALSIAWLWMLAQSLSRDIPALQGPDSRARTLAWVDLLSSLGLTLLHSIPRPASNLPRMQAEPLTMAPGLAAWRRAPGVTVAMDQPVAHPTTIALPDVPVAEGRTQFDFAFSNALNQLSNSQRAQLEHFKLPRPAALPAPIESGALQGLYRIERHLYAHIDNALYRVRQDTAGVLILDPQHPSRTGPWLRRDAEGRWSLDLAPKLRGGAPGDRIKAQRQKNRQAQQTMKAAQAQLSQGVARLAAAMTQRFETVKTQRDLYLAARTKLQNWWTLLAANTEQTKVAFLSQQHAQQLAVCEALKSSLEDALAAFSSEVDVLIKARRDLIRAIKPADAVLESSEFESARSNEYGAISAVQLLTHNLHLMMAMDSSTSPQGEPLLSMTRRVNLQRPADTPQAYQAMIPRLADMAEREEQLLKDTTALEATLTEHAQDSARGLNESRAFIRALPTQEMASAMNVVLNNLDLLKTLSIDTLKLTDAPQVQYFYQVMDEQNLRLASISHIALRTYAHFSALDRKAVLTTLIERYSTVERAARVLVEIEPALARAVYHARFVERLEQVRRAAESDLAGLIREEEGLPATVKAPTLREPRRSSQRVVKTQRRGALIGEVRAAQANEPMPVLEVRDPFNQQTIASFIEHPDEGVWKELVVAQPIKPVPAAKQRSLATLKQVAARLIEQGRELERSIVYQMRKLQEPSRREQVAPVDWDTMLTQQANKLTQVIDEIDTDHGARPGVPALLAHYRAEVAGMRGKATDYCSTGYKAQRPTQENVDYLWTHRQVDINLVHRRQPTAVGDYVAEFAVREKNSPTVLWYAHFHYADTEAPNTGYSVAHLKLANQRFLLQKDLVRDAVADDGALLRVIYAPVTPPLDQKLFLGLLGPGG